jgi:predicted dehydrogenase
MKKYVLAGTSSRGLGMFAQPITRRFQKTASLVGMWDPNPARAGYVSQECGGVPVFPDFEIMLQQYIIAGLEAGCDVITEKPMTIDAEKVRAILAAEKRTGHKVTVTFNYRFAPYTTRVKELLRAGVIGVPLSVDFHWLLDTSHGADYFRRWHRRMENSGGLLVHKATHHFDLVNWWIESDPQQVYAFGERRFYGPTRAERGERCSTCTHMATCEFFVDFRRDPTLKALYFDAEHVDGYFRDRCVFADEIDIYDTMSATVRYANGILLSYSLIAHCPYEGWKAAINGSEGRIELEIFESGLQSKDICMRMKLFNRKGELSEIQVPFATGGHGGSDERLQQRLFGDDGSPDPLGHMADSYAGAMSVLIGAAANQSIQTRQPVAIQDLLQP